MSFPLSKKREYRALLFVYGTLKEGERNNKLLKRRGAERLGDAETVEDYVLYHVEGGLYPYPAAFETPKRYRIKGEVYGVEDLSEIDRLEPQLVYHERRKVEVEHEEGPVEAWTYFIEEEELDRLKKEGKATELQNGDWSSSSPTLTR